MVRDIVRQCVIDTNAYVHTPFEHIADQASIVAAEAREQAARAQERYEAQHRDFMQATT